MRPAGFHAYPPRGGGFPMEPHRGTQPRGIAGGERVCLWVRTLRAGAVSYAAALIFGRIDKEGHHDR